MSLLDIDRVVDLSLFGAPDTYCDGKIVQARWADRMFCQKCNKNWLIEDVPKGHFPLAPFYSTVDEDSLKVLYWLRSKYIVTINLSDDGVVVKAKPSRFTPPWQQWNSGKRDSLPVALCVVALQASGFGMEVIDGWMNK